MDSAAVTSSLQSFLSPISTNESRLSSARNYSGSNVKDEVDSSQAASTPIMQDLNPVSQPFGSLAVTHGNQQLLIEQNLRSPFDSPLPQSSRQQFSPFSQSFMADGSSPVLTTMENDMGFASAEEHSKSSQNAIVSSGRRHHRVHDPASDPLVQFLTCGGADAAAMAELEAALDASSSLPPHDSSFVVVETAMREQDIRPNDHRPSERLSIHGSPLKFPTDQHHHVPGFGVSSTSVPEDGLNVSPSLEPIQSTSLLQADNQNKKSNFPPPPKKPLSPYMRFSKGVWQQVKATNPGMSVCEVGATIGRIWRELNDVDKQRFIDEFNVDKTRYDGELQIYLNVTGLQASDLIKPRGKKKETKDKQASARASNKQQQHQQDGQMAISSAANGSFPPEGGMDRATKPRQQGEMTSTEGGGQQQQQHPEGSYVMNHRDGVGMHQELMNSSLLPPFSQVWSNSDFLSNQDLLSQMTAMNGQTLYQQQQQQMEAESQKLLIEGNIMASPYRSDCGTIQNHQRMLVANNNVQRQPSSSVNCNVNDLSVGPSDVAAKGWSSWHQPNVTNAINGSSQGGVSMSNKGVVIYQMPTDADVSSWHSAVPQSNQDQPDRNITQLVMHSNPFDTREPPQMSTIHGAQFDGGAVYQMNSTATCSEDGRGGGGRPGDAEKLLLRNALCEKSEEVLRLMNELEQAYGLIHQLKQQNDFYHGQWNLQHKPSVSATPSSLSSTDLDTAGSSSGAQ